MTRISTSKALTPLELKQRTKAELQQELGLPQEARRMLVCMTVPVSDGASAELFAELLPGLLTLPVQIAVLGKGSSQVGSMISEASQKAPHMIAVAPAKALALLRAGSDAALFVGTPSEEELQACIDVATVPVTLPCPTVENYDPVQEHGTAFVYEKPTAWHAFAAIVRALETFVFPFDWKTIQKQCLRSTQEESEEE